MSDAPWFDVEADVEASSHHFAAAVAINRRGGFDRAGLDGYVMGMALMHAMQAGTTSLEAALLKLLDLLDEDAPIGTAISCGDAHGRSIYPSRVRRSWAPAWSGMSRRPDAFATALLIPATGSIPFEPGPRWKRPVGWL